MWVLKVKVISWPWPKVIYIWKLKLAFLRNDWAILNQILFCAWPKYQVSVSQDHWSSGLYFSFNLQAYILCSQKSGLNFQIRLVTKLTRSKFFPFNRQLELKVEKKNQLLEYRPTSICQIAILKTQPVSKWCAIPEHFPPLFYCYSTSFVLNWLIMKPQLYRSEPHHEKTNNVFSDQVWHKPGCTATGDG